MTCREQPAVFTHICDHCHLEEKSPYNRKPDEWWTIAALNEELDSVSGDFCPKCAMEAIKWLKSFGWDMPNAR